SLCAKETAFVEVVLFESSPNGEYTTFTTDLQGRFSRAGATISAEGEIVQMQWLGWGESLFWGGRGMVEKLSQEVFEVQMQCLICRFAAVITMRAV
ncbi:hypothetical protein chiPu_0029032, partial [Chiloscyllium punctatum]|nr:hypothetical protein [Chiloscyllium punctatum]